MKELENELLIIENDGEIEFVPTLQQVHALMQLLPSDYMNSYHQYLNHYIESVRQDTEPYDICLFKDSHDQLVFEW